MEKGLDQQELDAALLDAVRSEDETIVQSLLAAGADPNCLDGEGSTSLHHLAGIGSAKAGRILHALIAAGASPAARNIWGYTPLHHAAEFGTAKLVRALLDAGADSNAQDNDGRTPDDVACEEVKEFLAVRRAFLEEKALIDCLLPARSSSRRAQL